MIKLHPHIVLIVASVGLLAEASFAYSQYRLGIELDKLEVDQKDCPNGFACSFHHGN